MATKLISTGVQFPDNTTQTDVAGSGGVGNFYSDSGSNGSFSVGTSLMLNSSGKVEKVTSTTVSRTASSKLYITSDNTASSGKLFSMGCWGFGFTWVKGTGYSSCLMIKLACYSSFRSSITWGSTTVLDSSGCWRYPNAIYDSVTGKILVVYQCGTNLYTNMRVVTLTNPTTVNTVCARKYLSCAQYGSSWCLEYSKLTCEIMLLYQQSSYTWRIGKWTIDWSTGCNNNSNDYASWGCPVIAIGSNIQYVDSAYDHDRDILFFGVKCTTGWYKYYAHKPTSNKANGGTATAGFVQRQKALPQTFQSTTNDTGCSMTVWNYNDSCMWGVSMRQMCCLWSAQFDYDSSLSYFDFCYENIQCNTGSYAQRYNCFLFDGYTGNFVWTAAGNTVNAEIRQGFIEANKSVTWDAHNVCCVVSDCVPQGCSTAVQVECANTVELVYYDAYPSGGGNYCGSHNTWCAGGTNSTAKDFIGVANQSGTQGNLLKVTTRGGINSNQSGLSSASKYHVTANGTFSSVADAYGKEVGVALSSSALYLNK